MGPIRSVDELPIGWTDLQSPGSYNLEKRQDKAYFGYAVGRTPGKDSFFRRLLPCSECDGVEWVLPCSMKNRNIRAKCRIPGSRSCELHAIRIQDRVFIQHGGKFTIRTIGKRVARLFIVAVGMRIASGHLLLCIHEYRACPRTATDSIAAHFSTAKWLGIVKFSTRFGPRVDGTGRCIRYSR